MVRIIGKPLDVQCEVLTSVFKKDKSRAGAAVNQPSEPSGSAVLRNLAGMKSSRRQAAAQSGAPGHTPVSSEVPASRAQITAPAAEHAQHAAGAGQHGNEVDSGVDTELVADLASLGLGGAIDRFEADTHEPPAATVVSPQRQPSETIESSHGAAEPARTHGAQAAAAETAPHGEHVATPSTPSTHSHSTEAASAGHATGAAQTAETQATGHIPADLALVLARPPSQHPVGSPEQHAAIDHQVGQLHQLFTNSYTGTAAGWGGNLFHATLREGGVTFVSTVLRELAGQAVAKGLANASEQTKLGASIAVLVGTGMLNGAAMLRQHLDGTGNWITRSAQLANIAALAAAGSVAGTTGTLGDIAPLLLKATAYTLSRDGINLFVRLSDNRDPDRAPINFKAVATNMAVFGVNQFVVNTLQGLGVSYSGTSKSGQAATVSQAFGHISAFAAANAGGEISDAMLYPAMTAFFDKIGESISQGSKGTVRQGLRGAADVRLATRIHLPAGSELINRVTGHEVVGTVTGSDVKDKITGAVTARLTLFVVLFCLLDSINKAGQNLPQAGHETVTNLIAGLAGGMMLSTFMSSLSLTPKRDATGSQDSVRGPSSDADAMEAGRAGAAVEGAAPTVASAATSARVA
ncbi:hypothetical protein [Burkholderia sp. BCC1998]|uniref:hypothetical protein n=1 Tax=Burkholderia sp. BCC1998 TaxID=2817447 RepID=UPI002AB6C560|nr:hypothetical protein [Burkholderia sp. BCC1998]